MPLKPPTNCCCFACCGETLLINVLCGPITKVSPIINVFIPPSPAGSGLYLNFPHMGFYDGAEPSTTSYTVTANGSSNYIIDGVAQPTLTLQVGYTYVFDIPTHCEVVYFT